MMTWRGLRSMGRYRREHTHPVRRVIGTSHSPLAALPGRPNHLRRDDDTQAGDLEVAVRHVPAVPGARLGKGARGGRATGGPD